MAISPRCDICKKELTEFGAILLSPPDESGSVRKFHVCAECYMKLCETYNINRPVAD